MTGTRRSLRLEGQRDRGKDTDYSLIKQDKRKAKVEVDVS